jgi:hypothetical protein
LIILIDKRNNSGKIIEEMITLYPFILTNLYNEGNIFIQELSQNNLEKRINVKDIN